MKYKKQIILFGSAFLLTSCSDNKTPLKGLREDFLSASPNLLANNVLSQKINLSKEIVNDEWSQNSGNEKHHMPVLALDSTLNKKWEKKSGSGSRSGQYMISNIVANKQAVYTMDAYGDVFAHTLDGKLIWSKETAPKGRKDDALGGGVSFLGDVLIITSSFGDVIAVRRTTGEELWKTPVCSPIKTSATIFDDKVFVVTSSNEIFALDIKSGTVLWSHQGLNEASALLGGASPTVFKDKVIVAYTSGEYCAYDINTGAILWNDTLTSALRSDTVTSIAHIKSNPIIDGNMVYVISHGGKMVANDLESGTRQWQKEIGGSLDAALDGNFLFMIDHINNLYAIEKTKGEIAWSASLSDMLPTSLTDRHLVRFNAPLLANSKILISASNGYIMMIDPKTGKLENTVETDKKITTSPIIMGKKLIVFSDDAHLCVFGE
ncbi:MAG: PQQ-binding-like beta-propeller repeat protein [Proteobacteria bacterium]|nr:PQQ-binding-like beta-propeller repeat protein [Pseudomonadota bacterium]